MKQIYLAIALMCFSQFTMAVSYTLKIPEDELQRKVSAMMPLEKTKFFVKVILSEPVVDLLKENNEISVLSNINVIAPAGIKGAGKVKMSGSLTYDAGQAAFYFKNPKIIDIEVDRFPEKHIPKVKSIAQTIANKMLTKYPVYKLKDNNLKHKLAKSVLKSLGVKNEILLVELSVF